MIRPQPRDSVALMEGYHSPQIDVDVRLNTNESPELPPSGFVEEVSAAISKIEWHRYPQRSATELRTEIGKLHGVGHEQVFAANGSNEVLQTLLLTYGGPGRSAAIFEPTYALHSHLSRITGTDVIEGERTADFFLDMDEVERVITGSRPAITFLCSPNNPTGVVDTEDQIRRVLELVSDVGGILCVDEAYGQFADFSAIDLIGPDVPLVVSRTYSKTWAMAAARLGYLVAPGWIIAELEKVVLPYHLDAMTQVAGTLALRHLSAMNERVDRLVEERGRLMAELANLSVDVWPSASNFVLFRPREHEGVDVWQGLVDRSILIRNCASWPRLEGCLRVTIGTPDEDDRFLAALMEVLA
ncbi:MAG: histidinol-phosphate transaminase [Acidimicrobiaceae bacterium]|jgi:histidinol-phosphate aminotransferase|nr:histidinol-phosphate transaminase [Acidimicrobiaceae bacterium]MBT5848879.1 histidinol-phosphate transaminase [Acidimicrobiaceae bacterium]